MNTTDKLAEALRAMLTHMGMDEDEWNKPTFDQARAALAALEAEAKPAPAEPVAWEFKHVTDPLTEWKRVIPRTGQTLEQALTEIQGYRYGNRATYEVRALYAAPAAPAPSPDWRELTRRLFVELWHCDRQMMSVKKYGKPVFQQGQTVRDVLADAKAALEASKGGAA